MDLDDIIEGKFKYTSRVDEALIFLAKEMKIMKERINEAEIDISIRERVCDDRFYDR